MGLREEKKRATRAALSWAAIRLTVERGTDDVLVEDIATAAGVSPRTFNNYFSSKGEAIASRHLDRCLKMASDLLSRPSDEPLWESLPAVAMAMLQPGPEVVAQPVLDREKWVAGIRVMVAEPAHQGDMLRASAQAEEALARSVAVRTGLDADTDLYPRLVAGAVMAAINVATAQWLRDGATGDVAGLVTDALARVAGGLSPPPA